MRKMLRNNIHENVDTFIHEKIISDILSMRFCLNFLYVVCVLFEIPCKMSRLRYRQQRPVIIIFYLEHRYYRNIYEYI